MRKIVTNHINPPIPVRQFDWCAYFDGEEEAGNYGYGATEADAISDFVNNHAREPDIALSAHDAVAQLKWIAAFAQEARDHPNTVDEIQSRAEFALRMLGDILFQQRAFIEHWQADIAAGLKPTPLSLDAALRRLGFDREAEMALAAENGMVEDRHAYRKDVQS